MMLDQNMREAIVNILVRAQQCSADTHGHVQGFPLDLLAQLQHEFDKDCRKHGRKPLRLP